MSANVSETTIFGQIWAGEKPGYFLYRSEEHDIMAMLDVHPATPGHTLVVPREPVEQLRQLPLKRYLQVTAAGKFIADHLEAVLEPTPLRVPQYAIEYGVAHGHLQVVPSYERSDTRELWREGRINEPIDHEALAAMQERVELSMVASAALDSQLRRISVG